MQHILYLRYANANVNTINNNVYQGWRNFLRSRANILNLKNKNILACHVHYLFYLHSLLFIIIYYKNIFDLFWLFSKINVTQTVSDEIHC